MLKTLKPEQAPVVKLSTDVSVRTTIPESHYPALRSGFEGYPPNPRWNVSKFRAWKTGQQWRNDLKEGKMKVRRDRMLVFAKS